MTETNREIAERIAWAVGAGTRLALAADIEAALDAKDQPKQSAVVDGTGWAEAAFDEGPPDPQVLAMMLRGRQGLGYNAFAGFK